MRSKLWLIGVLLVLGIFMSGGTQCLEGKSEYHKLNVKKIKAFYLAGYPGDIKVRDFDKDKVVTLVGGNAGNFDISKDGKKIVYASCKSGTWQIYIADINGDKLLNTRMLSDGISRSEDPRFSWDNSKIVYKRNGDIVVCALDGSIIQEITNTPNIEEWGPDFAPDGKIAYARKKGENYQIVVWNNNVEQVVASGWYDAFYPSFGVDDTLYFVGKHHKGEEDDIYCIHPGATSIEKLPSPIDLPRASDADPYPLVGTNKKLIAFVSDRDSSKCRYEGYIADLETNEVSKIVSDTESVLNLIVEQSENENEYYEPKFTFSPGNPRVNQTVTFNASSSYDPDGSIVSYYWNFGDNTNASGMIVNHTYTSPGNYTVTLTVRDSNGATNSISKTVTVHFQGAGNAIVISYPETQWPTAKIDRNGNGIPEYIMEIDPWNIASADGKAVMTYDPATGIFKYSENLTNVVEKNAGGWVFAYPEVYYGNKPWNNYNATDGSIPLPEKVSNLSNFYVTLDYSLNYEQGLPINLALESWLTREKWRNSGIKGNEEEMMVWLYYDGMQPAGSKIGKITVPITVNGKAVNATFEVWKGNIGWEYIAFRIKTPIRSGNVTIPYAAFVREAMKVSSLSDYSSLYLEDVELGTEHGSPSTTSAELNWAIRQFELKPVSGAGNNLKNGSEHHKLKVKNWAIQLQDADPNAIAASIFELVVIDYSRDGSDQGKYSQKEIQKMKDSGVIPIAYLSIGEAEDYRFYWKKEWYNNPPEWLGKENPEWEGDYAVKYWNKKWKAILHTYLDKIIEQGFSGVYLDKVDEFEYWANPNNGENEYFPEDETAKRMIDLIIDIANYSRSRVNGEFYIIPQNGERILKYDNGTLINIISGWGAEDLFYNGTKQWDNEDMNWILENRIPYLNMVLSKGKPVFSVDYVDDGSGHIGVNKERIDQYRKKALNRGYIPYAAISDRELDELNAIGGLNHGGVNPECMRFL